MCIIIIDFLFQNTRLMCNVVLVHPDQKLAFVLESSNKMYGKSPSIGIDRVILKWSYQVWVLFRGSGWREEILLDKEIETVRARKYSPRHTKPFFLLISRLLLQN
jgi:hypothetical protein